MSDSRKRFEEWAKERGLQYDAQNVSRYEGWSARDSEVERLREALELIANTDPVDACLDPQRAVRVARAVLSSQDKESA